MSPSRLPTLGRRGEGWVVLQGVVLIAFVVIATSGTPWPASVRTPLRIIGTLVAMAGAALALAALFNLGRSLTAMPRPLEGAVMKTGGAYALVRHPAYGGLILLVLGISLATTPVALLPAAALALLFEGKRRVEERWLVDHYEGYADYKRRVRHAFLPGIW